MTLLVKKIANHVQNANNISIMADNHRQELRGNPISWCCNLVNNKTEEQCLIIKGIDDHSAKVIFGFIKDTLEEFKISEHGLLSKI